MKAKSKRKGKLDGLEKKSRNKLYNKEIERLQAEMVILQEWIKHKGLRVIILFEGRDGAGKGGVIKRITARTNPRIVRVVALGTPTDRQKTQWYFQRYVEQLPAAGEMILFDRSWYNRAGVEKVMGFCTNNEYKAFLDTCPGYENELIRDGFILIKYWFSVSDDVQEERFQQRIQDPAKRWKLSPMDLQARSQWVDYSQAKDTMFERCDTKTSPWFVVNADDKKKARLNCMAHLLKQIPYKNITTKELKIPKKQKKKYKRPPMHAQKWIEEIY